MENTLVSWALNVRVRVLLKAAIKYFDESTVKWVCWRYFKSNITVERKTLLCGVPKPEKKDSVALTFQNDDLMKSMYELRARSSYYTRVGLDIFIVL